MLLLTTSKKKSNEMRGMKQNKKRSTRCVKIKYVGVQSWKAAHLSTFEIRVEQKGNRVKKEIKVGEKRIENQCCRDRESNPGPVDN